MYKYLFEVKVSIQFHLANGLVVDLQVLGVVSIDLTGYVSISLWNRKSESLIRNSYVFL